MYANSHVNLKCISATHPRLVAKGKDLFYTSMENTAVVTNSYEFQVLVLSQNDIGNYVCYGTHDSGKPFATESKLILGGKFTLNAIEAESCLYFYVESDMF